MRKLAMLLVLGCGGGPSHGSVAIGDLGTEIRASYCMKEFACCTDAEVMMDFGSFTVGGQPITTEPQCEMFYSGFVGALISSDYMTSIANNRITYDGGAAGACIDAIDALSCSDFGSKNIDGSTNCKAFVIPLVDAGGGCAQSYECKSNNCVGATTQPLKDGACVELPGSGQKCTFDCATGLFCDFSMSSTCQPTRANGGTCSSGSNCTSGFCNNGSTSSGTCADKPARCDGR